MFKVNTKQLFEEILQNPQTQIMKIPLLVLHRKMLQIAQIANEQQNKEIMQICCSLALYKECDEYSSDFSEKDYKTLCK